MCIRTSKTSETADITQTDRLKDGFSPGLGSGQGGQPGHGQPGGGRGGKGWLTDVSVLVITKGSPGHQRPSSVKSSRTLPLMVTTCTGSFNPC